LAKDVKMQNRLLIIVVALFSALLVFMACAGPTTTEVNNPAEVQAPAIQQTLQTSFQIADLQINPTEVNPGDEISITAVVKNIDATESTYTAELRINNSIEEIVDVVIPIGGTQSLNFLVYKDVPGLYSVLLGESSGQFVIVKPDELTQSGNTAIGVSKLPVAPDFSGIDVVVNKEVSLAQFEGSVVLLNFVNYGCSRTLSKIVAAQLMVIRDLREQRRDFEPVSIFCGCCPPEVLREFATTNNLTWTWILDTENSILPQYGDYIVENGFPTLIFIDKNGNISDVTGYCDYFTLNNILTETH
jgi:hypothetical protein